MRFKVEPRDLAIFICFCIFLLYMCAIGVLNASSLARTGSFYGFLPFEAFTGDYIGSTLCFFFLALVGIFAAVSSYIFDRESGFGIKLGKKDKGYSRWARSREIKKVLSKVSPSADKLNEAGIVIINNGKEMWVDNSSAHYVIIGATGSGKTDMVVLPTVKTLAKASESMILTDPKGELYERSATMLREKGYNIVVLNFREPQKGNAWNPMTLPYQLYKEGNTDKAIELLDDLALNILYEEKSSGDPFWEKAGADYFTGLALGLFEDADESQINLNSLNLMASVGEERFGGPNNNYLKEYFNSKDPAKPAYINASGTVFTAEETKQGILATFKQKVKLFSSRDNLSEMLSYSDFDMHDIGRKKTAVYIIVQDEKKTLHPLATIFIKQCYETLIDVAQENGGELAHRTNFILDEFANMPPLKDVTTMVTAARSRRIRFTFIIQSYSQLTQVYGKENGETIKGNCNTIYLISTELAALEEISKMCGEVKSKDKDKTASTPLITVSDLQRLQMGESIYLRMRSMPYRTKNTYDKKMEQLGQWGRSYEKAILPERDKKQVDLWDIREFVKAQKQAKMEEMMSSVDDAPMFGNPFGGMPQIAPAEGGFNVDDLVKKIDAKIAELEAEEQAEKANSDNVEKANSDNVKDAEIIDPVSGTNENDKELYDDNTSDDQFFDDFFADD